MKFLFFIIIICFTLSSCGTNKNKYVNYEYSLKSLIDSLHVNKSSIKVLVDKSDYILTILSDTNVLKEYPIVLGGNTVDDKLKQGDQCTPEGVFSVIMKYPHKEWSKFIWIDYPTNDSWKKHNKAKKDGIIPKDSKIGGEIGIHGLPSGMDKLIDLKYNWTLGCVSLKNEDVEEIYPYIEKGTSVEIQK